MTRSFSIVVLSVALAAGCAPSDAPTVTTPLDTIGSIERLDPGMDAVIAEGTRIEILSEGHEWTEGPVWVPALETVLYSDIPNNAIYAWSEGDSASLWLQPSGISRDEAQGGEPGSNGLRLDADGQLILAQHGARQIARLAAPWDAPVADYEPMAQEWDGKRFNSPNDLAIHSNGDIYFTDPPYGLPGRMDDPDKQIPFQGVYRLAVDGTVAMLVDSLSRPNGIALSPDEQTLFVANSDRGRPMIAAYPLQDGMVGEGEIFHEIWGDGIAFDTEGRLYIAGPDQGVRVVSPDGHHLGTIHTTQATSNLVFGDDGSTLYITADAYLLRVRLLSTGLGF